MPSNELHSHLIEKTIRSEIVYAGRMVSLRADQVTLPSGKEAKRLVLVHPGAVCILPLTATEEVVLVRQYRHATQEVLLEAPAGTAHREETPHETACRELQEETGYLANQWEPLGAAWTTPGFCTERMYYFLATQLESGTQALDEDELTEVVTVPFSRCFDLIRSGEIRDNKTIVALYLAKDFRGVSSGWKLG